MQGHGGRRCAKDGLTELKDGIGGVSDALDAPEGDGQLLKGFGSASGAFRFTSSGVQRRTQRAHENAGHDEQAGLHDLQRIGDDRLADRRNEEEHVTDEAEHRGAQAAPQRPQPGRQSNRDHVRQEADVVVRDRIDRRLDADREEGDQRRPDERMCRRLRLPREHAAPQRSSEARPTGLSDDRAWQSLFSASHHVLRVRPTVEPRLHRGTAEPSRLQTHDRQVRTTRAIRRSSTIIRHDAASPRDAALHRNRARTRSRPP